MWRALSHHSKFYKNGLNRVTGFMRHATATRFKHVVKECRQVCRPLCGTRRVVQELCSELAQKSLGGLGAQYLKRKKVAKVVDGDGGVVWWWWGTRSSLTR